VHLEHAGDIADRQHRGEIVHAFLSASTGLARPQSRAAGIAQHPWSVFQIAELLDEPVKRGAPSANDVVHEGDG
jgi:hypothetical protein